MYSKPLLSDTPAFSKKNIVKDRVSFIACLFSIDFIRLYYSENVS